LARDPAGVAVFVRSENDAITEGFRRRLQRALGARGVDPARQLLFLDRLGHGDYLRVNQLCDVMLDTLHWSGGNTSLDALAAGLPIVACPGTMMRGRQSAAMLRAIGLPALVVATPAEAVTRAIEVASETAPGIRKQIARERNA